MFQKFRKIFQEMHFRISRNKKSCKISVIIFLLNYRNIFFLLNFTLIFSNFLNTNKEKRRKATKSGKFLSIIITKLDNFFY